MQILDILDNLQVKYVTKGKNVSRGWIGLSCPFCSDKSNHLGIHLESGAFKCWRCSKKGHISFLLQKILQIPKYQAEEILKDVEFASKMERLENRSRNPLQVNTLFNSYIFPLPSEYREYLISRSYDPDLLQRKYGVRAGGDIGEQKFRIVAPITLNGQIVSFIGRDISGSSQQRYKMCYDDDALYPRREVLYNFDTVSDTICIVEGVTDVWRIGDGSVATLSTAFSTEQITLILTKKIKRAFILFDSEDMAQKKAEDLAARLTIKIPNVEVIQLDAGDPAELSEEDVKLLRREIF